MYLKFLPSNVTFAAKLIENVFSTFLVIHTASKDDKTDSTSFSDSSNYFWLKRDSIGKSNF